MQPETHVLFLRKIFAINPEPSYLGLNGKENEDCGPGFCRASGISEHGPGFDEENKEKAERKWYLQ